ncbi:hypothetical protein Stsp02_48180 [Streptomyces sp. NBRC 14336]|uniref:NHLP leader peptide family natural product n=1 Tax=Streptomyces fuscus TaxID=3048495 RepID=A0ABT7ISD7_9ACTN|nr:MULTISPECIES: hypothetical protein [Streptomyces]MCM1973516.1 hypothetical protein [Streptomyces sp. G1]MDL2075495.1 hypothetical protein [Streptomyces fuscus]WBO79357.1 hypothetical protein SBE_003052 [Streptomyces sp. SBE_14.2]GLW49157.1 hypothetical protein Stsp02_48180 [Streptomyces sp. NBRC 14336]
MALDPQQRAEFVNAYTRVLISSWSDESFAARLQSEPRTALAEAGLELPADAEIVIVTQAPEGHEEGNLDVQVGLWEQGLETGRYEFHVPATPAVDAAELSEGDLSDVAAGCNYCCCPCCCCT